LWDSEHPSTLPQSGTVRRCLKHWTGEKRNRRRTRVPRREIGREARDPVLNLSQCAGLYVHRAREDCVLIRSCILENVCFPIEKKHYSSSGNWRTPKMKYIICRLNCCGKCYVMKRRALSRFTVCTIAERRCNEKACLKLIVLNNRFVGRFCPWFYLDWVTRLITLESQYHCISKTISDGQNIESKTHPAPAAPALLRNESFNRTF